MDDFIIPKNVMDDLIGMEGSFFNGHKPFSFTNSLAHRFFERLNLLDPGELPSWKGRKSLRYIIDYADDLWKLTIELPGIDKSKVSLKVRTSKDVSKTALSLFIDDKESYKFFPPSDADLDKTTATLKDGLLVIDFPRKEHGEEKARVIEIQ